MSEEKTRENEITSSSISIKRSTYNNLIKGIVVAIAVAAFVSGYSLGTLNDDSSSSFTSEELEKIISGIKVDSASQPSQQPTPQPSQQPSQPSAPQITMVSLDDDPVKGNSDAPVTIVEFSDFQCPFCSRFYQQTLSSLQESYIDTGKVKFVYRDLPLDRLHPNARAAHIAAECADEQGKFWDYHDVLFDKQTEWQSLPATEFTSTLIQYAMDLELKTASFESCLNSQEIADEVNKDATQARGYGVSATPTFFIGNEKDGYTMLRGAQGFASFQSVIDKQLG